MVTTKIVDPLEAERSWDGWLSEFEDAHFRQSFGWSRFKRGSWTPVYFGLFDGPKPSGLALALERRLPLGTATLLWINGGPAFRRRRPATENFAALEKLLELIETRSNSAQGGLARISIGEPIDTDVRLLLLQRGWSRPSSRLDTGLTFILDLTQDPTALRAGLERKWRNQLKQAEKATSELTCGQGGELIGRYLRLHNALCERKNLKAARLSRQHLERMAGALGDRILFFLLSTGGRDACGGAVCLFGRKAYLSFTGATDEGLSLNLPNLLYWRMIERLRSMGVERFDLSGIDPRGNWGVYNFKRGLGAPAVELGGEWERSSGRIRAAAFNLALSALKGRWL